MALQTSADNPAALRTLSSMLGQWIGRLGWIWVEAQVAELNRRHSRVYLTLRDTEADLSLQASCSTAVIDSVATPIVPGAKVVVHARPSYYDRRGSLSLYVDQIRPIGLGDLLARLEQRRQLLAAEGLFAAERKRALPFLPRSIGLVTGRSSAAERDVVHNGRRRWPGVQFQIENVAVQGTSAAREIIDAVRRLEADTAVDVIVVARGGGSLEDLLPFSDEGLVRVISAIYTPVVSAIGHEQDTPLLDLVADLRASTPTDAAKQVVPDVTDEISGVRQARQRLSRAVDQHIEREQRLLSSLCSRPSLAAPYGLAEQRRTDVLELQGRARHSLARRLDRADEDLAHRLARVRALSPLATLRRGYAVVTTDDGRVLTSTAQARQGAALAIRLSDGRVLTEITGLEPDTTAAPLKPDHSEAVNPSQPSKREKGAPDDRSHS
ncbi:MAG: exodeoxyribonuclease VII large subunit [Actinomycetota bacterium]|nr:exodeoxyribonuclease VII large subunit [Actinomycetota bacterium]